VFVVGGLELPADVDLSSYTLLFVGDGDTSSRQYINTMLRFISMPSGPSQHWTYSPAAHTLETALPSTLQRQLNRRFYLTQKARDASVYGILVGTLSQRHFRSVVSTLRNVIEDAGKSCYTFAVGKINQAKLANFGEIDCFVLVACGENSLLDNERDLHVPVITPLELDIALGHVDWGSMAYSLDYNDFLAMKRSPAKTGDDDEDSPYFSLVSGKYVDFKKTSSLDLAALPGKGQLATYKSEAADYLKKREYQGLEANIGKTEVHAAVPGQSGIASDYGNR
jgi:diphthamide biosynthesis protein 2